jgi:hypothetical protein
MKPASCPARSPPCAARRGERRARAHRPALGESIWFDELIYTRIPALPQPGTPIAPAEASLAIRGKAPDPATIGEFAEALGSAGPCAKPRLVPGNVKQYNR